MVGPPENSPPSPPSRGLDRFAQRALVAVGVVALVVIAIVIVWYTAWVWLVLFAGIMLAVFLRALTIGFSRVSRLPEGWSLAAVCVLLVAVVVAAVWRLSPRVTEQISELRETLPVALEALAEESRRFAWGDFLFRQLEDFETEQFQPMLAAAAATMVQNIGTTLVVFVVVLFLGIYLAMQPRLYMEGVARLFTKPRRPRVREVLHRTGTMLMWWLLGRIVAMAFVGVAVAVGLWALGVPLAFTLGLIAGLLDFIPNVGPVAAAVPAVLLAFTESPELALWVIGLYFVVQQLESYVVTPIVQQQVVHLPPALTVFAQVLFFVMAGVLGLLLATPIATAGLVLARELYVKDTLGDDEDEEEAEERPGRDRRPAVVRMREARAQDRAQARGD